MSFTIHENGKIEPDNDETINEGGDYYEEPKPDIYDEIHNERQRQDKQRGGAEHDNTHVLADWLDMIDYQLGKYSAINGCAKTIPPDGEREQLIKIAALAVAAVESMDRQNNR